MVDRNSIVKSALNIEIDHLVDGERGRRLFDIREGTAISHGLQWSLAYPKKFTYAHTIETVAPGQAVATRGFTRTIDDRLRNQDSVKRYLLEDFVGVQVIALATAQFVASLQLEIKAGIHLI